MDVEDLDVARIRRLRPEDQMAERATTESLAQEAVLDHVQP
jgi:hypothetical protein